MKNTLCFIGSNGIFSLTALQTLLAQRINISHIILSGYAPAIPTNIDAAILPSPLAISSSAYRSSIPSLASQFRIPIYYAGNEISNFSSWNNFSHEPPPDYLFVACFPGRLPAALRQWPKKWATNLHPSLLPAYRGPDPFFWQLRNGDPQTGFSLHLLTDAFDEGPILLQKPVHFPPGASRNELDTLFARQGAEAFCTLLSTTAPTPIEQDPKAATHYPLPQCKDYTIPAHWPAARAYNFICGTHTPADGYPILLDGQQHRITSALGFETNQLLAKKNMRSDDEILIQFSSGVLRANSV